MCRCTEEEKFRGPRAQLRVYKRKLGGQLWQHKWQWERN